MKKFDIKNKKVQTPFTNPENYFETFSEKLQKRIDGEIEPEYISKRTPFGFPEKYFELLPQRIMKRIASAKKKVWYRERYSWRWATIACSLLLLAWLGQDVWLYFNQKPIEKAEAKLIEDLKSIDKEDIEHYLVSNQSKVVLFEELQESKIEIKNTPKTKSEKSKGLFDSIPKNDLEELIPEEMWKEVIEEELGEESFEDTFSEKDTMGL